MYLQLGANIRKLRTEQRMTQQKLAARLCISYQAISKWENGASTPDITMLPLIAGCFGVTIDELFQPNIAIYRSRAERLLDEYEARQTDELFHLAKAEYEALIASEGRTCQDLTDWAFLFDLRARGHMRRAEEGYREAIALGGEGEYKAQRQLIGLLARMGRGSESVSQHRQMLERDSRAENYVSLIAALIENREHAEALSVARAAMERYPGDALICCYAGDACKHLGDFDGAMNLWERSFALDPEMCDGLYAKAQLLAEQGRAEDAAVVYRFIVKWLRERDLFTEGCPAQCALEGILRREAWQNDG